jgi:hypothetical protein
LEFVRDFDSIRVHFPLRNEVFCYWLEKSCSLRFLVDPKSLVFEFTSVFPSITQLENKPENLTCFRFARRFFRKHLNLDCNPPKKMIVVQLIVVFLAISEVTSSRLLVQYKYWNPKLENLISRVMNELNARDSSTHDVALLHNVFMSYNRPFINDICDFVLRSMPKENLVTRSQMNKRMKNRRLRKADVIIMVTDENDTVSEA